MTDGTENRTGNRRLLFVFAVALLCLAVTAWLENETDSPLREIERIVQDWRVTHTRPAPRDPALVLLAIDRPEYRDVPLADDPEAEASEPLRMLRERYPWPRSFWAATIEKLLEARARKVLVDILFTGEGSGDPELARVLDTYPERVVLAFDIWENEDSGTGAGYFSLGLPATSVLADDRPVAEEPRLGFTHIWPDSDGILRRHPYRLTESRILRDMEDPTPAGPANPLLSSLAARAAPSLEPRGESRRIRFAGPPYETFPTWPVENIHRTNLWRTRFADGEYFRDRIVLIGPTASIFQDSHATPHGHGTPMPGAEIHLHLINAALTGSFIDELSPARTRLLLALAALIGALTSHFLRRPFLRLLALAAITAGYWGTSHIVYDRFDLLLPDLAPAAILIAIGGLTIVRDYVDEQLERRKLRQTMAYYFSPDVLEAVLEDPGVVRPRRAEVTMLLADIRNSTPIAELMEPEAFFALLNELFELLTTSVMEQDGNLEHFLGDQFLSYWGAPKSMPEPVDRAYRAAQRILTELPRLVARMPADIQSLFGCGLGIGIGTVLFGNKGSVQRLDYGLVGDAVNQAARVEALTRLYELPLLMTAPAWSAMVDPPPMRRIDRIVVKGKTAPVELIEPRHAANASHFTELTVAYETAWRTYAEGDFAGALPAFEALAIKHHDGPSRCLAERCRQLASNPPPDWNGTWFLTHK